MRHVFADLQSRAADLVDLLLRSDVGRVLSRPVHLGPVDMTIDGHRVGIVLTSSVTLVQWQWLAVQFAAMALALAIAVLALWLFSARTALALLVSVIVTYGLWFVPMADRVVAELRPWDEDRLRVIVYVIALSIAARARPGQIADRSGGTQTVPTQIQALIPSGLLWRVAVGVAIGLALLQYAALGVGQPLWLFEHIIAHVLQLVGVAQSDLDSLRLLLHRYVAARSSFPWDGMADSPRFLAESGGLLGVLAVTAVGGHAVRLGLSFALATTELRGDAIQWLYRVGPPSLFFFFAVLVLFGPQVTLLAFAAVVVVVTGVLVVQEIQRYRTEEMQRRRERIQARRDEIQARREGLA